MKLEASLFRIKKEPKPPSALTLWQAEEPKTLSPLNIERIFDNYSVFYQIKVSNRKITGHILDTRTFEHHLKIWHKDDPVIFLVYDLAEQSAQYVNGVKVNNRVYTLPAVFDTSINEAIKRLITIVQSRKNQRQINRRGVVQNLQKHSEGSGSNEEVEQQMFERVPEEAKGSEKEKPRLRKKNVNSRPSEADSQATLSLWEILP